MNIQFALAEDLSPIIGLPASNIFEMFETPPNPELGDLSLPCFTLAKEMRKAPKLIAKGFADAIHDRIKMKTDESEASTLLKLLDRAEALNGYLNLFYDRSTLASTVLNEIETAGEKYGCSETGMGKRVIVEFSSPNIAKPFHVGHLCSTVIGNALANIYTHLGYETLKINHLGDWGTQFGKLMVAWRNWGDEDALRKTPIRELLRVYVKFHEEAIAVPSLEDEARTWFKKLEDGDPDAHTLWERFTRQSLDEFERIYSVLDIHFDLVQGESFYQDKLAEIRAMLCHKALLMHSEGALVVSLEDEGMPPCLIEKSDGASTYATRDLAAALFRNRQYRFEKCLYVVGTPQALHFRQVFSVLGRLGYEWHQDCLLIGFGLVRFADRKLSTRTGDVIFLEDVLDEAIQRCAAKMKDDRLEKVENNSAEGISVTAKMVGIGAIIYAFLKNGREHDMIFSWEESLDFDGDSGPYIQYTHARAKSILRIHERSVMDMSEATSAERVRQTPLTHELEFQLVKHLDGFKAAVVNAADKNEPSLVARQIALIARTYNRFYAACPVRTAAPDIRTGRLKLTEGVCQVLKIGMRLLGIRMPDAM